MKSKKNRFEISSLRKQYQIGQWILKEINEIHEVLEKPHWAPWLSFSKDGMQSMAANFPEGQLVIKDIEDELLAYISTNRINWNGRLRTLPTWDTVAGGQVNQATYGNTYIPDGNTLVILCLTVGANHQGKKLPVILIDECKRLADKLNIKHIISPFRPSSYGNYKLENNDPGFKEYISMKRDDGLPIDAWLRNLVRNGMKPLVVREDSLVVKVPVMDFERYKSTYNPKKWKEVSQNVWECGEVGLWFLENEKAIYREPELWGRIPIKYT